MARHGKISILDTNITSWDASVSGPDVRVLEDGRAYIAALSAENARSGKVYTSRMDVENSEISHLGNDGDYHSDIGTSVRWMLLPYLPAWPAFFSETARNQRALRDWFICSAWVAHLVLLLVCCTYPGR